MLLTAPFRKNIFKFDTDKANLENPDGKAVMSEFLESLLSGNHSVCSRIVNNYLDNKMSIEELYENIIKKSMYEVGEMWENNRIGVATEHLASSVVERILNEVYEKVIPAKVLNKKAIASCVENEYHQIGIKMISDIFEMNGWTSHFFGASTSTAELIMYARDIRPDILAFSVSISLNIPVLFKMIEIFNAEFPGVLILVGGQAFQRAGRDAISKYENAIYLPDIHTTDLFIKSLNTKEKTA